MCACTRFVLAERVGRGVCKLFVSVSGVVECRFIQV